MGDHVAAKPSKEHEKEAQEMWEGFTKIMKCGVISTCALLILLALIFV